jgi:SAM-dependent methyltransferase
LPDAFHAEFTGERVIPGRVEDNLFNEHLARYRFAARLAQDLHLDGAFLDAGCGAGYGSAELAKSGAQVLGIDVSSEAIAHASSNYAPSDAGSRLRFEQASCTAIPAHDTAFRLITAFEVIEHLTNWRDLLAEARRVLDPNGIFLVSTPNQLYYAESRQKAGPNPFHVHEFTEQEFRAELAPFFPHVKMLLQNHIEGIALSGADTEGAALEISTREDNPSSAHFFLAVCSLQPLPSITSFVFIPETGNVLQTRERHIALLDGEILKKNQWIEVEKTERSRMIEKVRTLEAELEEHNRWASQANQEAERRARLVAELQGELHKSNEWAQARDTEANERGQLIAQLQQELARSNEWAQSRDADAVERGQRVEQLQAEVAQATEWAMSRDAEAEERGQRVVELQKEMAASSAGYEAAIEQWRREKAAADQWALDNERRLTLELENAQVQLASMRDSLGIAKQRLDMIAQSRWVRLGRAVRVGPEIPRT